MLCFDVRIIGNTGWQDFSEITFSELTQLVAGFLLDANPPHDDLRINANQQTQVTLN